MRKTFLFFVMLPAIAFCELPAQIDSLFSEYNQAGVPGASVVVIQNGQILYEKGYGLANLEASQSATATTDYRLASLTKQFTAMAVLQLIDQKRLHLDDTLTQLFPEFPSYGKKITLRHMLNHTSGLHDYEDLIPKDQTSQVHDADVLALLEKETTTYFTPGAQYRYCNGGYVLLGLVVQKTAGISFASYLKQNIFAPLGMNNTVAYEQGISTVPERAYGYSPTQSGFERTDQSVTSATLGDGGIYSSVHELFLWDQALYTDRLVSADLLKLAFTPGTLNNGDTTGYGFGWFLDTYRGTPRVYHTGSTLGFRSYIGRLPEKKFSVAVLVNREGETPTPIGEQITDLVVFHAFR